MKKRILGILIIGMMMTLNVLSIKAASGTHDVEYDGEKLVLNTKEGENVFAGLTPGDSVEFEVTFANEGTKKTNWYLENKVLQTLEENGDAAKNGGYSYELTYVNAAGASTVLFSSDNIGGENGDSLHDATQSTEDYFFLDSLQPKQGAKIVVKVTLDGESQPNGYMDTKALLGVSFAVEEEDSQIIIIPNTGDVNMAEHMERNRGFYTAVFCGSFFVSVAALGAVILLGKKKEGAR